MTTYVQGQVLFAFLDKQSVDYDLGDLSVNDYLYQNATLYVDQIGNTFSAGIAVYRGLGITLFPLSTDGNVRTLSIPGALTEEGYIDTYDVWGFYIDYVIETSGGKYVWKKINKGAVGDSGWSDTIDTDDEEERNITLWGGGEYDPRYGRLYFAIFKSRVGREYNMKTYDFSGSQKNSETVTYGNTYNTPGEPSGISSGQTFDGWQVKSQNNNNILGNLVSTSFIVNFSENFKLIPRSTSEDRGFEDRNYTRDVVIKFDNSYTVPTLSLQINYKKEYIVSGFKVVAFKQYVASRFWTNSGDFAWWRYATTNGAYDAQVIIGGSTITHPSVGRYHNLIWEHEILSFSSPTSYSAVKIFIYNNNVYYSASDDFIGIRSKSPTYNRITIPYSSFKNITSISDTTWKVINIQSDPDIITHNTQTNDDLQWVNNIRLNIVCVVTPTSGSKGIDLNIRVRPHNGGSTYSTVTATYGRNFTVVPVPTKSGYELLGYTFDKRVAGTGHSFNPLLTSDETLNESTTYYIDAVWQGQSYRIRYFGNGNTGGSDPGNSEGNYSGAGVTVNLKSNTYSKTGMSFLGWGETDDATVYVTQYVFWSSVPSSPYNKDVYAIWQTLDITFYDIDDVQIGSVRSPNADGTLDPPSIPVEEGYKFVNWYTTSERTTVMTSTSQGTSAYAGYHRVTVLFIEDTIESGLLQSILSGTFSSTPISFENVPVNISKVDTVPFFDKMGVKTTTWEWFGFFKPTNGGYYLFSANMNGGDYCHLWIGSNAQEGYIDKELHSGEIQINAGTSVPIRIRFSGDFRTWNRFLFRYQFKTNSGDSYSALAQVPASNFYRLTYEILNLKTTSADVGVIDGAVPSYDTVSDETYWTSTPNAQPSGADLYVAGLIQRKYSGTCGTDAGWFNYKTPESEDITSDVISIPAFYNVAISYLWIGFFKPDKRGYYKFETRSDDSSVMWIGSNAVSDYELSNRHTYVARWGPSTGIDEDIYISSTDEYIPIRIQFGGGGSWNSFSYFKYKCKEDFYGDYTGLVNVPHSFLFHDPRSYNIVENVEGGYQTSSTQPTRFLYSNYAQTRVKKYTIGYIYGIGVSTVQIRQTITHDVPWQTIDAIQIVGYDFGGWFTGVNGGGDNRPIDQDITVYANETLYAKQDEIQYTITYYETEGGSDDDSITSGPDPNTSTFSITNFGTVPGFVNEGGTLYVDLSRVPYEQPGKTQTGWLVEHIGITTNDDSVELGASNVRFIFQYTSVGIYPKWDANKYEIRYKPSTTNTFYQDAGYNFYLPEDQIYYHSDIFTGGSPTLVLKPLYVEYKGFRSIGWTKQDGINVLVSIPQDFKTANGLDVKPAIDLYIAWEKIEYKILNNTFNHESIYSLVKDEEFFYTFSKRLNHIVKFKNNAGDYLYYDGKTGLVINNDLYGELEYVFDGKEITLNDAYDFFYEDDNLPSVKSLKSLQNKYKTSSLIELTDVIVMKHYPITVSQHTSTSIIGTYDLYYEFMNSDVSNNFEIEQRCICEILLVGGGGRGGDGTSNIYGGGGGAGAVVHIPFITLEIGTYSISVGKGGSSSGSSTSSTISLGGLIIVEAKGGGEGGYHSDTSGKDGGSGGGGASVVSSQLLSYGGGEGDNHILQPNKYLYQNYGHTNNATNAGGGGGGAGFYSVNTDGGNGIQINIDNQNNYYGGGGGGGGVANGGNGGSGLVIIKIKEGYDINHTDDESMFEPDLIKTVRIGEPTGGYFEGSTTITNDIEFEGDVDGRAKLLKYYGYFKALQTKNYLFQIKHNAYNSTCKFNLGFRTNNISNETNNGEHIVQIYLEKDVFYPMDIEFITNISAAHVEIKYDLSDTTISPDQLLSYSFSWKNMTNPSTSSSFSHQFLFHLKTFPGTTSMRTLKT